MVRQHDATRPDADGFCTPGNVADAHRRSSAGNAREIVVFGQPETPEAGGLDVLGQVEGIGQRIGRGEAFTDIGKVENGKIYHGAIVAQLCHAAIRVDPNRAREHQAAINNAKANAAAQNELVAAQRRLVKQATRFLVVEIKFPISQLEKGKALAREISKRIKKRKAAKAE